MQNGVSLSQDDGAKVIELHDGHIAPPLVAFASTLGLAEIEAEPDTVDGVNNDDTTSRAVDGLALDTKGLMLSPTASRRLYLHQRSSAADTKVSVRAS